MPKLASIEILRGRKYLRVSECAAVFGRGSDFWALAFDDRKVAGYRDGGAKRDGAVVGTRYIEAESAAAYLRSIGTQQRVTVSGDYRRDVQRMNQEFCNRHAASPPGP